MLKTVTFGEIMLRLSPEGYKRFVQADSFCADFGGAEANVAVSLANFGLDVDYVTKIPQNEIGQLCINELRSFGVGISKIVRGGDRLGIYYVEKGASQRPSKVIYDRKCSSICEASESDFDWESIFKDVAWFHITGITPALSDNCASLCLRACKIAKEKCITVSCDLNFRKKLWTSEKANAVMSEICKYVDVCIANEEDAFNFFGISSKKSNVEQGLLKYEDYELVAKALS